MFRQALQRLRPGFICWGISPALFHISKESGESWTGSIHSGSSARECGMTVQLNPSAIIACNLWDEVQFGIWWGGESYEIKQTRYFKSLLTPGSVVFDVGANVGYYSLISAPLVGPGGRVYAFEPASQQFALLKNNASRNGLCQILPHKLALSEKSGQAILHLEDEFNTGTASLRQAGPIDRLDEIVTCTTLDDFADSQVLDRLDVVKIDVEGNELTVLRGGRRTLEMFHPTLLVEVKEHHQVLAGCSSHELFEWLIALNYLPFRINSGTRPTPIESPEDGNLIAFRYVSKNG